MHILLIVSWYKDNSNPISGSFFEEHARDLPNRDHTYIGLWDIQVNYIFEYINNILRVNNVMFTAKCFNFIFC